MTVVENTFEWALSYLKAGNLIYRRCWNEGEFVTLLNPAILNKVDILKSSLLNDNIKKEMLTNSTVFISDMMIKFKTNLQFMYNYIPNAEDIFATDWEYKQ
jgi:hypothetical protein